MKKQFFLAAFMLLGAGVVATSCSNEDVSVINDQNQGTTHMSLLIGLPQANGALRAPAQDGQDADNPNYNHVGEWKGRDKIENIDVYVFGDGDKLEKYQRFPSGQFQLFQPKATGSTQTYIKPLKGIQVKPGAKKVYVVVNPTANTLTLLPKVETTTTVAEFEQKLNSDELTFASNTLIQKPTSAFTTRADEVAKIDGTEDVILMTGVQGTKTIDDNVTEHTTLNTDKNRVAVTVSRAVARVLVSTVQEKYNITGEKPGTVDPATSPDVTLGEISDITFVVGQGEAKMYFTQQASAENTLWAFKTPASGFVPADGSYSTPGGTEANAAAGHYDYSSLWKGYDKSGIKGVQVTSRTWHVEGDKPGTNNNITGALDTQVSGEFLLPNTHKYGVDADATEYRKGNTAYVLVRAKFTPKFVTSRTGDVSEVTNAETSFPGYPEGKLNMADPSTAYEAAGKGTFVLGANGHFYASIADAQAHMPNMECSVYPEGKVLYFAWVNPDVVTSSGTGAPRWFNSPVIRNNIYHIQIKGFQKVGANWNPLVPGDPKRPENPDPKPNNPKEPKNPNGVDPKDPLTPKETWMSVHTTILPWEVHSYEIELQ